MNSCPRTDYACLFSISYFLFSYTSTATSPRSLTSAQRSQSHSSLVLSRFHWARPGAYISDKESPGHQGRKQTLSLQILEVCCSVPLLSHLHKNAGLLLLPKNLWSLLFSLLRFYSLTHPRHLYLVLVLSRPVAPFFCPPRVLSPLPPCFGDPCSPSC